MSRTRRYRSPRRILKREIQQLEIQIEGLKGKPLLIARSILKGKQIRLRKLEYERRRNRGGGGK